MNVMVVNPRARKSEALEYQADIDWAEMSRDDIAFALADYETDDGRPESHYSVADGMLDAAEGQPGTVYGFRGGVGGTESAILKFEDGQFYLGQNVDPMAFASLAGDDGEDDYKKLDVIPAPRGGGALQQQTVGEATEEAVMDPKEPKKESAAVRLHRHRMRMGEAKEVSGVADSMRAVLTEDATSAITGILGKKDKGEWTDVGDELLPALQKSGDAEHMGDVANAVDELEDAGKIDKKEQPGSEGGDQVRMKESLVERLLGTESVTESVTETVKPVKVADSVASIVESLLGPSREEHDLTENEADRIASALLGD